MAAAPMPEGDVLAGTPCAVCDLPIEVGQRFYQANAWATLGHAACVEDNLDVWDTLVAARYGEVDKQLAEIDDAYDRAIDAQP